MALIEWTDSFSIGIPAMDQQHRHLIELINKLDQAVRISKKNPATPAILTELVEYTKSHFEAEEKVMKESGYPGIEEHRAIHQKLLREVTDTMEKVNSGKLTASTNTSDFLQIWLEKHLAGYDCKYAEHIAAMKTAGTAM